MDEVAVSARLSRTRIRPYDEMRTPRGKVREAYRDFISEFEGLTPEDRERARKESLRLFKGDNALSPIPRIFTREEFERIERGVKQRATALLRFLEDHYSGEKTYQKVIPLERVEEIIARSHEEGFEAFVHPSSITFPYGPDIIRDPVGDFRVVEDNIGYIGGPGDLQRARSALFEIAPGLQAKLPPLNDIDEFYRTMVEDARKRATPPDGRIVIYMVPPFPDNENKRLATIMEAHGVEFVTPSSPRRLVVTNDGVFLTPVAAKGEPERVGFIFLNGEHRWVDASHPVTRRAYLISEAEDAIADPQTLPKARKQLQEALLPDPDTGEVDIKGLKRALRHAGVLNTFDFKDARAVPGLMTAIAKGLVATDYTPGIDFIGDKEFKQYVDDLVRHYLGEEPLLPSIPVHSFLADAAAKTVDEAKLSRLFSRGAYRGYVFKIVNGRGGDGIYIGPKMSPEEALALKEKIRADPGMYVAEPYTPISVLDGKIVDCRAISMVTPEAVTVAEPPWCRGVSVEGNGKVNLSSHGEEIAAIVLPPPA